MRQAASSRPSSPSRDIPEVVRMAKCPKCNDNELLLVTTLDDGNGKTSYTYACPSCGKSWPFPEG